MGKKSVSACQLGGHWALWLAEQPSSPVAATAVLYGSRGGDHTQSRSALQFHLAETDPYVSASGVKGLRKSLKAAGREAEFYTCADTGHWFFESDRPEACRPEAAELAPGGNGRVLEEAPDQCTMHKAQCTIVD